MHLHANRPMRRSGVVVGALRAFNEWKGLPLDMRLINFRAIIG